MTQTNPHGIETGRTGSPGSASISSAMKRLVFRNWGPLQPLLKAPMESPRVWLTFGWNDVVQSYRRTFLGPLWITLNLVIFATAMTLVYGAMFGVPTRQYSAYVVCGMMAWFWISALLTEVGNTFVTNAYYIRSAPIEKSHFLWAVVYKQLLILAHHLPVYVGLLLFGAIAPSFYILMLIPAVLLLFAFSLPVAAVTAILFARYRDLQRLVGSAIIILMLVTPVFWQPDMMKGWRAAIYTFNPFYYLIEIIRQPLLGVSSGLFPMTVVAAMTVIAWVVGSVFYRRYEKYVVFWV